MFIEPQLGRTPSGKRGWIEVICGCMFSGKTEELIRRLNRALIAQQKVEIFKPAVDTRYHNEPLIPDTTTKKLFRTASAKSGLHMCSLLQTLSYWQANAMW